MTREKALYSPADGRGRRRGPGPMKMAPIHLLIAHPDARIRDGIAAAMEGGGNVSAVSASTCREAVHALLHADVEVAMMSANLPGLDGSDLPARCRRIWPWLGMIGLASEGEDRRTSVSRGMPMAWLDPERTSPHMMRRTVHTEAMWHRRRLRGHAAGAGRTSLRQQLRHLRHLAQTVWENQTLTDLLRSLGIGVQSIFRADVAGVLEIDEEPVLAVYAAVRVAPDVLGIFEEEILSQAEWLRGGALNRQRLHAFHFGVAGGGNSPAVLESLLSLPLLHEGRLVGLAVAGAVQAHAFSGIDVEFAHHVAHQLATAALTFRHIRQIAIHDELTGLHNRRYLREALRYLWPLAERHREAISVVVVDLDDFKKLNDEFGHQAGDRLLREFAAVLSGVARSSDIVVRHGGDEFVVIMPQTRLPEARVFAARLIDDVRRRTFLRPDINVPLRLSAGIADSERAQSHFPDVLARADRALYRAKQGGRNGVAFWSHDAAEPELAVGSSPASSVEAAGEPPPPARVLVVDDEPAVTRMLASALEQVPDYTVATAAGVDEAAALLRSSDARFDAVVTDLSMPGRSGLELLRELRQIDDTIATVVISGYTTVENAIDSLRQGAFDFMAKPVAIDQFRRTVRRAVEHGRLVRENRHYQQHLEDEVRTQGAALSTALNDVRTSYRMTIESLATILDVREQETGRHSQRVSELTVLLARELDVPPEEMPAVEYGALLHDLGKIGVPDSILLKPQPLNEAEWAVMRRHPEIGCRFVRGIPFLAGAAEIIHCHHEHYDGSGYPRTLRGSEIPFGARIFAVIDAYDAMRIDRIYRRAVSADAAREEVQRNAGTQFDPTVVDCFLRLWATIERQGYGSTPVMIGPDPITIPPTPRDARRR